MSIQTHDPVVIRADLSGYVSPAHARARELGWCPDCVAIAQYVLLAPGLGTCLYHSRPAENASDGPEALTPTDTHAEPSTAILAPETGPFQGGPTRRRAARPTARPNGRYAAPHMMAVICALPAGSRRAADQAEALRAYEEHPDRWDMRSDRDARTRRIWRALVFAADWKTLCYTGTWDVLAERAGVSRSTVARAIRWCQAAGLLGVVHTGASAAYTGGDTNRAPSYVLAVVDVSAGHAPVDELDTPTEGESSVDNQITRESVDGSSALRLESEIAKPTRAVRPSWSLSMAPTTRAARLAAAEALIWHAPTIRRVSARLVRHVLGAFFRAGWSPNDVLWALDHRPDGVASRITGPVHTPAAWMRHRLAAWLAGGQPIPSRSQQAHAAHTALLAARKAGRVNL